MNRSEIVVRLNRRTVVQLAAAALVVGYGPDLWSAAYTLTASYPVPSGIYNKLVTTGNAGRAPANTVLNRDAGNTVLVPASNRAGKVGVGMAPVNKLDVAGSIGATGAVKAASLESAAGVKLGDDLDACTAAKAGTLRFRNGSLQACDGGFWVDPYSDLGGLLAVYFAWGWDGSAFHFYNDVSICSPSANPPPQVIVMPATSGCSSPVFTETEGWSGTASLKASFMRANCQVFRYETSFWCRIRNPVTFSVNGVPVTRGY